MIQFDLRLYNLRHGNCFLSSVGTWQGWTQIETWKSLAEVFYAVVTQKIIWFSAPWRNLFDIFFWFITLKEHLLYGYFKKGTFIKVMSSAQNWPISSWHSSFKEIYWFHFIAVLYWETVKSHWQNSFVGKISAQPHTCIIYLISEIQLVVYYAIPSH